jgi:hypothetical protein
MWPETSGPVELNDATSRADDGWPDDKARKPDPGWPNDAADGPDPGWPNDDAEDERDPDWPDDWPDDGGEDPPWRRAAPPAAHGRDGGPGRPRLRPLVLAIVTMVALGGGAGVALAITKGIDHSTSPSATPSTQPPALAPGGSSGGGVIPGGGGAVGQMFVAGPVTAVSSTSITIGGPDHTVTAAITSATRISGKVSSIGGIKVGDQVSAQITQSNGGRPTVTAIQYPAQAPSGGGLP